jgi:hypothetical protein
LLTVIDPSTYGLANTTTTPEVCTATIPITATASITYFITYYNNFTVIPYVTPYSNGTNVTNFVTITATSPPPSAGVTW